MTYAPLFLHLEFNVIDEPSALSPVGKVCMGYVKPDGSLAEGEFPATTPASDMWTKACDAVRAMFRNASAPVAIVGWDLRGLVWPAFVYNVAVHGGTLPRACLKQMDKRWNDSLMVDLRDVFLQGGYSRSQFSLDDVVFGFTDHSVDIPESAVGKLRFLHDRYSGLMA